MRKHREQRLHFGLHITTSNNSLAHIFTIAFQNIRFDTAIVGAMVLFQRLIEALANALEMRPILVVNNISIFNIKDLNGTQKIIISILSTISFFSNDLLQANWTSENDIAIVKVREDGNRLALKGETQSETIYG